MSNCTEMNRPALSHQFPEKCKVYLPHISPGRVDLTAENSSGRKNNVAICEH